MTEIYTTKDGRTFNDYQAYVAHKRRINDQVIRSLGLEKPLLSLNKTPKKKNTKRKKATTPESSVRRRSKRLQNEAAAPSAADALKSYTSLDLVLLGEDDEDPIRRRSRNKKKQKKSRRQSELSPQERQTLRSTCNWLDDMESYLRHEEELSSQNLRSVMRQVEKLVSGVGITYHHWRDETVIFGKNRKGIPLAEDFEALHVQAIDFENEHGRDLGNGWLLRHPIQKLANFQRYTLEQKKKKKGNAKYCRFRELVQNGIFCSLKINMCPK